MSTDLKRFDLVGVCCTTRCIGKCFSCSHNAYDIGKIDLDLDVLIPLLPNTNYLSLNGIWGDAIFNPKVLKFAAECENHEYLNWEIATNGGAKDDSFWAELGGTKVKIIFGIDGLEDTHHMYRGTDFNKVIHNMSVFIENGGNAEWQFIIFNYNQHQIEQASLMGKKLGCSRFFTIRANEYDDIHQKPTTIDSRNEVLECGELFHKEIHCYWKFRHGKEFNSIFVNVFGNVFPCCHTAVYDFPNMKYLDVLGDKKLKEMFVNYKDQLSLYDHDIFDIIKSPYFEYVNKNVNKLNICKRKCLRNLSMRML
jgi:hypothetical protein